MVHLCRRGECCSTVMGVQGYSRWWPRRAARSPSGRRRSASLRLGKRPFQSSARWWRQRQGSCTARTFQLRSRTTPYLQILLCIFFDSSNTDTWTCRTSGLHAETTDAWCCKNQPKWQQTPWKITQQHICVHDMLFLTYGHTWAASRSTWVWLSLGCSRWGGCCRTGRSLYCRWTAPSSQRWSGCLWALYDCAPRFQGPDISWLVHHKKQVMMMIIYHAVSGGSGSRVIKKKCILNKGKYLFTLLTEHYFSRIKDRWCTDKFLILQRSVWMMQKMIKFNWLISSLFSTHSSSL